jgi:hypothetical protein
VRDTAFYFGADNFELCVGGQQTSDLIESFADGSKFRFAVLPTAMIREPIFVSKAEL